MDNDEDNATMLTDMSTILNSPPREDLNGSKRQRSQKDTGPDLILPPNNIISQFHLRQTAAPETEHSKRLISKLKDLYKYKVRPIEKKNLYLYRFCLPTSGPILDAEFDARPMVLLLGPYSTGKTTFLRYLLGGDFPGMHVGPEPTTDKFMALVHGNDDGVSYDDDHDDDDDEDDQPVKDYFRLNNNSQAPLQHYQGKVIKGNTLTVTPELPFASLSDFGASLLNHFNGSVCSSPLLRNITLIDTPGVLSGEKQNVSSRDYNFSSAAKWFADRSDLVLLLVDAHKLDFSDELKDVIDTIRPHNDDKIRCILNKADGVSRDQLIRVYGSLMWSLGKLFHSPEVIRVYAGSFWEHALEHDDFKNMFEADEWQLMNELMNLPSVSAERKVNAMVQRIRMIKVHICILGFLRAQMPRWYGKEHIRRHLLETLEDVFTQVRLLYNLPIGDFPNVDRFRECLEHFEDFTVFPYVDLNILRQLVDLIIKDIPAIMKGSGGVSDSKSKPRNKRRVVKSPLESPEPNFTLKDASYQSKRSWPMRMILSILMVATLTCAIVTYCVMPFGLTASLHQDPAIVEL